MSNQNSNVKNAAGMLPLEVTALGIATALETLYAQPSHNPAVASSLEAELEVCFAAIDKLEAEFLSLLANAVGVDESEITASQYAAESNLDEQAAYYSGI